MARKARGEAWRVAWEREVARWAATPGGKATMAMYAAAEKAGCAEPLRTWGAEVLVEEYGGKTRARMTYEHETHEREELVFPRAEWERAEAWLASYGSRRGWEVSR